MRIYKVVMELILIMFLQMICMFLMGLATDYFALWLLCWIALAIVFWRAAYDYWSHP